MIYDVQSISNISIQRPQRSLGKADTYLKNKTKPGVSKKKKTLDFEKQCWTFEQKKKDMEIWDSMSMWNHITLKMQVKNINVYLYN